METIVEAKGEDTIENAPGSFHDNNIYAPAEDDDEFGLVCEEQISDIENSLNVGSKGHKFD